MHLLQEIETKQPEIETNKNSIRENIMQSKILKRGSVAKPTLKSLDIRGKWSMTIGHICLSLERGFKIHWFGGQGCKRFNFEYKTFHFEF